MDKDITEELEENVMSLVPETTTTTQGNLFRGIVNWLNLWYKDQNSPFDNNFSNNLSSFQLETKNRLPYMVSIQEIIFGKNNIKNFFRI